MSYGDGVTVQARDLGNVAHSFYRDLGHSEQNSIQPHAPQASLLDSLRSYAVMARTSKVFGAGDVREKTGILAVNGLDKSLVAVPCALDAGGSPEESDWTQFRENEPSLAHLKPFYENFDPIGMINSHQGPAAFGHSADATMMMTTMFRGQRTGHVFASRNATLGTNDPVYLDLPTYHEIDEVRRCLAHGDRHVIPIILRPLTELLDVRCGPFVEFEDPLFIRTVANVFTDVTAENGYSGNTHDLTLETTQVVPVYRLPARNYVGLTAPPSDSGYYS